MIFGNRFDDSIGQKESDKMVKLVFVFFLFGYAATGFASERPELTIQEGENEIFLTIKNQTDQPVRQLEIEVKQDLPDWLRIRSQSFFVENQKDQLENIKFSIIAENAPVRGRAEILLGLKDDQGRYWEASVELHLANMILNKNQLKQNAPNPFNPETIIEYHLAGSEIRPITLIIYNVLGQKVRTLVDATKAGGVYRVRWDGKDDLGQQAASGVYTYRLVSGEFVETKQMILLK